MVMRAWNAFWEMFGGDLIAFVEIAAWANLTGERLTPWETGLVRRMSIEAVGEMRDG